jgi:NADPH:quinone reductase-like Zn-dependent oxidoreductase
LKTNGIYVTVGGSMGRILQVLFLSPWIRKIRKKHVTLVALKANKELIYMNELFESGKMKPVIDAREYKLEDVPEAFRFFGRAEHKGKVVISLLP